MSYHTVMSEHLTIRGWIAMLWIARLVLFASFPGLLHAQTTDKGLTAVEGVKVGHHTLSERPTGCTVILTEAGAVGGVDVRGGAPGTRETDLLDPVNLVEKVHAVVLAGGSAFGLDAASGTMRYLDEKGIGYPVGPVRVPIVTGAILFDLFTGGKPHVRPTADCGYKDNGCGRSGYPATVDRLSSFVDHRRDQCRRLIVKHDAEA